MHDPNQQNPMWRCPHCPLQFTNEFGLSVHIGMRHNSKRKRNIPVLKMDNRTALQLNILKRFLSEKELKTLSARYNQALQTKTEGKLTKLAEKWVKFIKEHPELSVHAACKALGINEAKLNREIAKQYI